MLLSTEMTGEMIGAFLEELSILDISNPEIVCRMKGPDRLIVGVSFSSTEDEKNVRNSFARGQLSHFKEFFPAL